MNKKIRDDILYDSNVDMLSEIFRKQELFQLALKYDVTKMTDKERVEYIKWNSIAMFDEICESLRETPWKPWKKKQSLNIERYREELIDLLHFFVNACLVSGMTADDLFDKYCTKMKENIDRQMMKY
jgi:dimeric dUTPase (all-alpha-NTP-PPase superfamily)